MLLHHARRSCFLVAASLTLAVLAPLVRTTASTAATTPDCSAVAANLSGLGLKPQARTSSEGYAYTTWTGKVAAWDGIPLAVDLTLPASSNCDLPLVALNHGYGQTRQLFDSASFAGASPLLYHYNDAWFASRGFAVLAFDARGFGQSCGKAASSNGSASGLPTACTANGRAYWINLDDVRYSLRDLQWLIGRLVDAGVADPARIAASGGSMGGELSLEAAVLNDRTVCGGRSYNTASGVADPCAGQAGLATVPWTSPQGVPLHLTAAVPEFSWFSFVSAISPNGRATDGLAGAPAAGSDTDPVGIPKQSWADHLYTAGLQKGFFRPSSSTDGSSNFALWFQDLAYQQVNSVTAAATTTLGATLNAAFSQLDVAKSVGSGRFPVDARVPVLGVQGLGDSIFSSNQTELIRRMFTAYAPDYPFGVVYGDVGHTPASNRLDEWQLINDRVTSFLEFELLAKGSAPVFDTQTTMFRCLPSTTGESPTTVRAATLAAEQTDGIDFSRNVVRTTTNTSGGAEASATDAIAHPDCPRIPLQTDAGVAAWAFDTTDPLVVVGSPVVTLAAHSTAADAELNVRLWEIDPDKTQTLVARGTYRLVGTPTLTDRTVRVQLSGTAWRLPPQTRLRLEVTGNDAPTYAADAIPAVTTIDSVTLHLPTTDLAAYGHGSSVTTSTPAFSGAVATFGQAGTTQPDGYSAIVDWGDGSTSTGTITTQGASLAVLGSHDYAQPGRYVTTVTLTNTATGLQVVHHGSVNV